MEHKDIWHAIDVLANAKGVSTSMLAKMAGLDPTTFNKSKRIGKNGKKRWPSTESLAKVLDVTGSNLSDILPVLGEKSPTSGLTANDNNSCSIPFVEMDDVRDDAADRKFFDIEGNPVNIRENWDGLAVANIAKPDYFAMEVAGDDMHPFYSEGDVLIISAQASIRKEDIVIIKMASGNLFAKKYIKQTSSSLVVKGAEEIRFNINDVEWCSKVMWVSQ